MVKPVGLILYEPVFFPGIEYTLGIPGFAEAAVISGQCSDHIAFFPSKIGF